MKIKIFGGGHIGAINAYCLLKLGNKVEIYDKSKSRSDELLKRKPLFYERDLNWNEFYDSVNLVSSNSKSHDLA